MPPLPRSCVCWSLLLWSFSSFAAVFMEPSCSFSLHQPVLDLVLSSGNTCTRHFCSFTLTVMMKSFTLAEMLRLSDCLVNSRHVLWCCSSPWQTTGESSHSCFSPDPHLDGLPVFPLNRLMRALAVAMVLSLAGFSDIFSIIWSNSSLMVIPGKRSCPL